MIDKQRLQEAIYKYEYLIKDEKTIHDGHFAEHVFEDILGNKENEVNEYKQKYWRKKKKSGRIYLLKSEMTKKYLYILQVLPFQSRIYYYCFDLQKLIEYAKNNHKLSTLDGKNYTLGVSVDNDYKFKISSNDCLLESFYDLFYHNPGNIEIPYKNIENIQIDLLKKENSNFIDVRYKRVGYDIEINNITIELKATKIIQKDNTLKFNDTKSTISDYFIFSYIFQDEKEMINIIMKNYNYEIGNTSIPVPEEFVNIINNKNLSDTEKVEKLKEIHINYKNIPLRFYTTKEVFDFFNNLPPNPAKN